MAARVSAEVKKRAPKVAVELGGYCGYSAVRIGRLLPEGSRFISMEINPLFAAIATKIVELAGLSHKVVRRSLVVSVGSPGLRVADCWAVATGVSEGRAGGGDDAAAGC